MIFGSVEGNRKDGSKCLNVYYRSNPAFGDTYGTDVIGPTLVNDGEWSTLASRISSAFKDGMNKVEGLKEKTPGLTWESKITK